MATATVEERIVRVQELLRTAEDLYQQVDGTPCVTEFSYQGEVYRWRCGMFASLGERYDADDVARCELALDVELPASFRAFALAFGLGIGTPGSLAWLPLDTLRSPLIMDEPVLLRVARDYTDDVFLELPSGRLVVDEDNEVASDAIVQLETWVEYKLEGLRTRAAARDAAAMASTSSPRDRLQAAKPLPREQHLDVLVEVSAIATLEAHEWRSLVSSLWSAHRWGTAAAAGERALGQVDASGDATTDDVHRLRWLIGSSYMYLGDVRGIGHLERAIALAGRSADPPSDMIRVNLAFLRSRLGDLVGAIRELDATQGRVDGAPFTEFVRANLAEAGGDLAVAERHYRSALVSAPNWREALEALDRTLVAAGRPRERQDRLEWVGRRPPRGVRP